MTAQGTTPGCYHRFRGGREPGTPTLAGSTGSPLSYRGKRDRLLGLDPNTYGPRRSRPRPTVAEPIGARADPLPKEAIVGSGPPLTARIESRNGVARIALGGDLLIAALPVLQDRLARVEGDGARARPEGA
jgi:hypothetical protein